MVRNIINLTLYYCAWIAAIRGAASGDPTTGPLTALGVVSVHLLLLRSHWKRELSFVVAAVVVGTCIDSLLPLLNLISFAAPQPAVFGVYPFWMSSLWAGFATTFSLSLRWMQGRFRIGALFGAIGGPASLYAGTLLGAATIDQPETYLFAAVEWAFAMVVLLAIHQRLSASLRPGSLPRA